MCWHHTVISVKQILHMPSSGCLLCENLRCKRVTMNKLQLQIIIFVIDQSAYYFLNVYEMYEKL